MLNWLRDDYRKLMLVFDVRRLISTPDVPEWERWRRVVLSYADGWRRMFFEILRNGVEYGSCGGNGSQSDCGSGLEA